MLRAWDKLPELLRTEVVRPYYDALRRKRFALFCKRVFDFFVAFILLILLLPLFLALGVAIAIDSRGPVLYMQTRVTQYGRAFSIVKFRSMTRDADKTGAALTSANDARVTRVGRWMRRLRLDETPQLLNILAGQLSFAGTRPELPKFTAQYADEWNATLLLPAGVTSAASIAYKDEEALLCGAADPEAVYVNEILPAKMAINLAELRRFSFWRDLGTLARTLGAVAK